MSIKHRLGRWIIRPQVRRAPLLLISDGQGWILDAFCHELLAHLPGSWGEGFVLDYFPSDAHDKVIHFVERYRALRSDQLAPLCQTNRVVIMWWHGGAYVAEQVHLAGLLQRVQENADLPIHYHVVSSLYIDVLTELGVPRERIVHLPMGIELARFERSHSREQYKAQLGLPTDRICIGSFQRDGDEEPKLVKGPDVFVEVLERLAAHRNDLLVLLAGPKRGYVMRELDKLGIAYHYAGWVQAHEMAPYYFASDLYMITSREEGGPAAVLECMATGTPLVSTRVGMAVDVLLHGKNGFLADIEDVSALTEHALALIKDAQLWARISQAALATAPAYAWRVVARNYARLLYESNGGERG